MYKVRYYEQTLIEVKNMKDKYENKNSILLSNYLTIYSPKPRSRIKYYSNCVLFAFFRISNNNRNFVK